MPTHTCIGGGAESLWLDQPTQAIYLRSLGRDAKMSLMADFHQSEKRGTPRKYRMSQKFNLWRKIDFRLK
jgi:hypothetical protein